MAMRPTLLPACEEYNAALLQSVNNMPYTAYAFFRPALLFQICEQVHKFYPTYLQ